MLTLSVNVHNNADHQDPKKKKNVIENRSINEDDVIFYISLQIYAYWVPFDECNTNNRRNAESRLVAEWQI